ncbi:hypothetical protein LTS10_013280 [Elasticomyces elasticus]|nr:hypothetical protein LTS10_013280 [Elasticomyces elasticus]
MLLLQNKVGQLNDVAAAAEQLVAALGYIPLAIAQAATYIKKQASTCSVDHYLATLEEGEESMNNLLGANLDEPYLSRPYPSGEAIGGGSVVADELLDYQSIPKFLLRVENVAEPARKLRVLRTVIKRIRGRDGASEVLKGQTFQDDILTLQEYLFIFQTPDGGAFEMQRLVQLATRK